MKTLTHRLSRLKSTLLKLSYSPSYTSFLPNHIASNTLHPLHIAQRRRLANREKEGLWWHTTNGVDTSKSSCVRHWALRRLQQAFVEELSARGYDECGRLVDASKIQDSYVARVVSSGRSVHLTGSLRMHGVPSLVPAKYAAVKEEVRGIVDALVQSAVDAALENKVDGTKSREDWPTRAQNRGSRPAPARKHASNVKAQDAFMPMKGLKDELPRMKPAASPRSPLRSSTAAPAAPRLKPKAAPARAAPRSKKSSTMGLAEDYCI